MVERVCVCVWTWMCGCKCSCGCVSAHTVAVKHSDGADENKTTTDTIFYTIFFFLSIYSMKITTTTIQLRKCQTKTRFFQDHFFFHDADKFIYKTVG